MTRQWDTLGRPVALFDIGSTTTAPVAIATSLTNLFTITIADTGVYLIRAQVNLVNVGPPTGLTVTPGFNGTTSEVGYNVERHTGAATALARQSSFAVSASSVWIRAEIEGYFLATSPGNFTLGVTRTGGTSATAQIGCFLRVYPV